LPSGFLRGYLQLKDDVSEDAEDSEEEAQNEEPTEESSDSDDEVESLDSYETQYSVSEDDIKPSCVKGIYRKILTKIQYKTILQEDLDFFPEQLLMNEQMNYPISV
jgi:hypothetical protein